jgi:uncharacterized membrane protein
MNKTTIFALVASIIGFIDSAYLTFVKFTDTPIYCTPGLGDCATVQNSPYSELWGIPLALLGSLTYLALILLYLFGQKMRLFKSIQLHLVFGLGLFGFLFSLYLTYLEFFVIRALCQWCVLSALCMTAIFITTIIQLKRNQFQSI